VTTKYDDVAWHEMASQPRHRANHLGYFVHWLARRDLLAPGFRQDEHGREALGRLAREESTGYEFVVDACGGSLTDEDLSEQGVAFTRAYYASHYLADLDVVIPEKMRSQAVLNEPYNRDDCSRVARWLDGRFEEWQQGKLPSAPVVGLWQRIRRAILG
jgi:hypothetical protein